MRRCPSWLSLAEQKSLLEACGIIAEDDVNDLLSDIVDFALNVDMNKEEILSLAWKNVNLCRRAISVLRGGCTVIMFLEPEALEVLIRRGADALSSFVFSNEVERLETKVFDMAFLDAVNEAGLDDVCFEDLRKAHIAREYIFSVYSLMENADLNDDEICEVSGDHELHESWEKRKPLFK
jgi:hypothetical protein